jgi:hypothetical protein
MRARRAGRGLAAAAAVALLATAAQAATVPAVVVSDRDDARGRLDIARVSLERAADGRLRAGITMHGNWTAGDLRTRRGAPGSICVRLWIHRDAAAEPPDYSVCATAPATGENLRGAVMRDRSNGLPRKVAIASATRPTQRTVILRFGQSTIGTPGALRFGVETVSYRSGCGRPVGCRDTAPNAPSSAAFTVGAPTPPA